MAKLVEDWSFAFFPSQEEGCESGIFGFIVPKAHKLGEARERLRDNPRRARRPMETNPPATAEGHGLRAGHPPDEGDLDRAC